MDLDLDNSKLTLPHPSQPDKNHSVESEESQKRRRLVSRIVQLDVPMSQPDALRARVDSHLPLTPQDLNRLAHELATVDENQFAKVVQTAWTNYLEQFPHLRQITNRLKYGGYNPLYDRPPVLQTYVISDEVYSSVAQVSLDNSSLTTTLTDAEQRQLIVTQLLTPDYATLYPRACRQPHNADAIYRVWAHETGHTDLNPTYRKIVDAADAREQQERSDHLTVADKAGKHAAISAFQEAVVELAATEMLGTRVTTLPNDLFSTGKVGHLLTDLKAQSSSDEQTWDLWYSHPVRKEVSRMCRALIKARIQGYNPLDIGEKVNEIILKNIAANNMRHTSITYSLIADNIEAVIKTHQVEPTLPPLDTPPEQIDVFTSQRTVLQNLVAQAWIETSASQ